MKKMVSSIGKATKRMF